MSYSFFFFLYCFLNSVCILHLDPSPLGLATFPVLSSYMWLVAIDKDGMRSREKLRRLMPRMKVITIVWLSTSHQHRVGHGLVTQNQEGGIQLGGPQVRRGEGQWAQCPTMSVIPHPPSTDLSDFLSCLYLSCCFFTIFFKLSYFLNFNKFSRPWNFLMLPLVEKQDWLL